MGEDPQNLDRFKPAMPRIPGVTDTPPEPQAAGRYTRWKSTARVAVPLAAAMLLGIAIAWWTLRAPRPASTAPAAAALAAPAQTPQVAPPSPAPASRAAEPVVVPPIGPVEVAIIQELAKPWSSKRFFFRKRLTDQTVPALLVRLPGGPANRSSSYWAFSLQAPFGRCQLEYVTDLARLASHYGYRARHPMVGDPCTGTVYDPLRAGTIPGGAWVRGEVVQGGGIRPPIAIDVQVQGNRLLAAQIE